MLNTGRFDLRIGSLCIILSRYNWLWRSCVKFYIYFWCCALGFFTPGFLYFELHLFQFIISSNDLELQWKILPTKSWYGPSSLFLLLKGHAIFTLLCVPLMHCLHGKRQIFPWLSDKSFRWIFLIISAITFFYSSFHDRYCSKSKIYLICLTVLDGIFEAFIR